MDYVLKMIIVIISICYISYSECNRWSAINELGVLMKAQIDCTSLKLDEHKIFNNHEMYKSGAMYTDIYIKHNDKIFMLINILDSCNLDIVNKLLLNDKVEIKNTNQLDSYIEELFGYDPVYTFINPNEHNELLIPSMDSTVNKRFKERILKKGISYADYFIYFNNKSISEHNIIYLLNEKKQSPSRYFIEPEIHIRFINVITYKQNFYIEKINTKEAIEIIKRALSKPSENYPLPQ